MQIKLLQGDCLELMKIIPDCSVDMVLCDPPFGKTQCEWDKIIDFEALWKAYDRIVKPNGAIVLFANEPFASHLRLSNVENYKYDWVWRKPKGTGHLNCNIQPLRDAEYILVFYKKQCTYNPQFTKGKPYLASKVGKRNQTKVYGSFKEGAEFRNDNSGFRYPKTVLEFGVVERHTVHPTQKPVPLLEYLINTYTNKGEIVLDNCMGSGSTGVACVNTGRSFIGIELEEKYFEIAKEKIENLKMKI